MNKCRSSLLVLTLVIGLLCTFIAFWIPSTFTNDTLEERNLPSYLSGIYFASFSAPSLFLGFIFAKTAARCGRKRLLLGGVILAATFSTISGALNQIKDKTTFIILSCISRFFLGLGSITIRLIASPIVAINLPKHMN